MSFEWLYMAGSWILGLLDQSYSLLILVLGNNRPKFFKDGWEDSYLHGTRSREALLKKLDQHHRNDSFYNIADSIRWKKLPSADHRVTVTEGRFLSPQADQLPDVAKECQFFLVEPTSDSTVGSTDNDVVVIMLPATGEASKKARLATAKKLASRHGWRSVVVTAPFYAARKPSEQKLWFINNVNDFLHQSQAIMEEAAALACHYLDQSPTTRVCLTGFSWGGAMSSCATCIALLGGCDGKRLACVPYVGCPTPAVLPDGLLQSSIDWDALKKTTDETKTSVQKRLTSHLCEFDLSIFSGLVEKHRLFDDKTKREIAPLGALKVVAMNHDHIIQKSWSLDLVTEMTKLTTPLRSAVFPPMWLPGGHVFALLIKDPVHTRAIVEAVQAL